MLSHHWNSALQYFVTMGTGEVGVGISGGG